MTTARSSLPVPDPTNPGPTDGEPGPVAVVVLAAGLGSRMRSALPKPLHLVAGLPMATHVLGAAAAIDPWRTVLVVGEETHDLAARLGRDDILNVEQPTPKGTGDALRCALAAVAEASWVMVLFADHPLLTGETVTRFLRGARDAAARVTVLTCLLPDAEGFGRIERDAAGRLVRVVERKDDAPEARAGETEINSGMMLFETSWLRSAISRLTPSPATGEYYMTELVALAVADGPLPGGTWPAATVVAPRDVAYGVNDRGQLAQADAALRRRIRDGFTMSGVSFVAPETSVIDAGVEIGADTTVLPGSVIGTGTRIGRGCTVGPHAILDRATLDDGATVRSSTVSESRVGPSADVGPYAYVRGGSTLAARVHVGSHVELNRAAIGARTMVGHFSYLGDVTVGEDANVGAGVVTANYDGTAKHRTEIGDGAFIGSDTVLVAPVTIGANARTGAGAVVTHDVAPGETVVGVPARRFRSRPPRDDQRKGEP